MAEPYGRVIFLNGTSSSGKSTIAKELQQLLPAPYLHVALDGYLSQLPHVYFRANPDQFVPALPRLMAGFYAACAAIARAGNHIIVDTVLQEPAWREPCAAALADLSVAFVGVRCPLAVLEQREQARGDRRVGMARHQFDRIHAHGGYDLEVDTANLSATACAAQILAYLQSGQAPTAFARLRAVAIK